MNIVEPIRERDFINEFGIVLRSHSERDYVLFMSGLYLGRRISDILPLKVADVRGKDTIYFREKKTGKVSVLVINKQLAGIYNTYCEGKADDEYLFAPLHGNKKRHITRQQAWNVLNKAAAEIGYQEKIGCHSLRKTLGRKLHAEGVPIETIMLILGHDDVSTTKRYIGITADEINSVLKRVNYR